jgi:spermidine/putrescine transport system permease protein
MAMSESAIARLYRIYIICFFIYLVAPLIVVGLFAFNNSNFPSLPWQGFTTDWFFANGEHGRIGLFHDDRLMSALGVSIQIAIWVSLISTFLGLCFATLFERFRFPMQRFMYQAMLIPLVVPGVILGISLLVFFSGIANYFSDHWQIELDWLRPGIPLIIMGQVSFITTLCALVIGARLRKIDPQLEEAALNLGASSFTAWRTITLPWLLPALVGAGIMAVLMSFENFNTTLMLTGSDAPLTVSLFNRLREGSTPVLNAVSLLLLLGAGVLAALVVVIQGKSRDKSET